MFVVNEFWHRHFVIRELGAFFIEGSFASLVGLQIGRELHGTLVEYVEGDDVLSEHLPVEQLFEWLSGGWSLDPEWLAESDGSFTGDTGEVISPDVEPVYSSIEQLAAYGIWLLHSELPSPGPVPVPDLSSPWRMQTNEQGWSREAVQQHQAECLLQAYQTLAYAHTLRSGKQPSPAEMEKATLAAMARKAADARHVENRAVKADVFAWCDANMASFIGSMDDAAFLIAGKIVPLKYRAVRAHITDWKKVRSARKA